jgi:hypothetical protein
MTMTSEELIELFEKHLDTHYLTGTSRGQRDLQGFIRLNELDPKERDIVNGAGHDQIWLSIDLEQLASNATEDDVIYLLGCGIMYDDGYDGLTMFV